MPYVALTKQGVFDADLMNAINTMFAALFNGGGSSGKAITPTTVAATGAITAPSITVTGAATSATVVASGALTAASAAVSGALTSSSPSAGLGYVTGAGGTGTQGTDKTTTVVVSPAACLCGQITVNAAALNAATIVSFSVTDTALAVTDVVVINHISGGTLGAYTVNAHANAGSFTVTLRNNTAGNLSEALVLQFAVIKAVNA